MLDIVGEIKARIAATLRAAVFGVIAAVCGVVGILFLLIALFIWLAAQYDVLTACVILGLAFVFIGLAATLAFMLPRRRADRLARQRRARVAAQWWLDPRVLAGGLEIVRLMRTRPNTMLLLAAIASGFLLSSLQSPDRTDPPEP